MTSQTPVVDIANNTVTFAGATYTVQALGGDAFVVLLAGVPVGRLVYTFGSANGVPEGESVSEDDLTAIAEAWFAALDA